jgi:hypothetical protein
MGQDGQIRRDRIIIDTDPGIGAPPPSLSLPLFLSFFLALRFPCFLFPYAPNYGRN